MICNNADNLYPTVEHREIQTIYYKTKSRIFNTKPVYTILPTYNEI